jgi:ribosomal protein S18 acetylase RimI-like enzyme
MMIGFAVTHCDIDHARALFREYERSLGVDLAGTQNIDDEIASLPGKYAPPQGALLLARNDAGHALGCVAVRPFERPFTCELKRLYVRPVGRGGGVGRALMGAAIGFAAEAGYKDMLLDSLSTMHEAIGLYRSFGFSEIPPYWNNPLPGARYFSRSLDGSKSHMP